MSDARRTIHSMTLKWGTHHHHHIRRPSGPRTLRGRLIVLGVAIAVVVVVLVVGFVAVAVRDGAKASASASASALARTVYLQQYHQQFPGSTATDDQAVGIADSVCSAYAAGTTFIDEVTYLRTLNSNLTAGDAGAIIGMSTAAFCPQFNNRH